MVSNAEARMRPPHTHTDLHEVGRAQLWGREHGAGELMEDAQVVAQLVHRSAALRVCGWWW